MPRYENDGCCGTNDCCNPAADPCCPPDCC